LLEEKSKSKIQVSESTPRSRGDDKNEEVLEDIDTETDVDNSPNEAEDSEDTDSDSSPDDESAASGISAEDIPMLDRAAALVNTAPAQGRKRKRKEEEALEDKYLIKLAQEDMGSSDRAEKKVKSGNDEHKRSSDTSEDGDKDGEDEDEAPPMHESLTQSEKADEIEKSSRTLFLANVSTEAITSKQAKAQLMAHISSALDQSTTSPAKIESIRFRSVAFADGSLPKRAAYITKSLMDATTKSTNSYVVLSSQAAVRSAVTQLNGTEVLGRHIRVDSVAHPSPTDHRRCVFVGNLGFVDDETVLNTNKDGETTTKKRTKVPADVEEGLWRTFSKQAGKVENVRVVRDPKTRVGKGFAYVQFYVSPLPTLPSA
jgi:nucleolar protein 12